MICGPNSSAVSPNRRERCGRNIIVFAIYWRSVRIRSAPMPTLMRRCRLFRICAVVCNKRLRQPVAAAEVPGRNLAQALTATRRSAGAPAWTVAESAEQLAAQRCARECKLAQWRLASRQAQRQRHAQCIKPCSNVNNLLREEPGAAAAQGINDCRPTVASATNGLYASPICCGCGCKAQIDRRRSRTASPGAGARRASAATAYADALAQRASRRAS